ncbi:MAG TPA: cyclic nucleotide-binding domain-containing protein [Acidimicrobiia bacterium]|nr:cyclic nucleotide-binding domain-containing protein [Acidimicrobiia bacterium]
MTSLIDELERQPFLDGLSDEHLRFLSNFVDEVSYAEGEIMFRQGEPALDFFLIYEGKVAVEIDSPGGPIAIQTLRPGNLLGVSWLYPPHRWQFDSKAIAPTRAFRFDGDAVRAACDEDHTLGFELLGLFVVALGSRLQATRFQLLEILKRAAT